NIKLFGITNQMLELELDRIEKKFEIDLGRKKPKIQKDNDYYPQFDLNVRNEAKRMSRNYEVFYCLEKSIRNLINTMMESTKGEDWWNSEHAVPDAVKIEVKKRISNEIDSAVTLRSTDPIDFTTFGELAQIIQSNWAVFTSIFKSIKAVQGVMSKLNTLRAPIAHCTQLAEDEELRLQLSVRDWFRLME
ncbi:MAG: hypothetical protein JSU01_03750, partial [Bacteroidetes bacterium]|nr:hypothetical protein [Bacteroidota bacterium]